MCKSYFKTADLKNDLFLKLKIIKKSNKNVF